MNIPFYKYQGTGNDFILIDNREEIFPKASTSLIQKLCHRRFGIGADGLLLLESHPEYDFVMVYYNSDGNLSSMCGNGGRCIVHFASYLGIVIDKATFIAPDGAHTATIKGNSIALCMSDVQKVEQQDKYTFLDTGSPHHVQMVSGVDTYPVVENGKALRYSKYGETGANINFVEKLESNVFAVRTYERGVEAETYSCGTGVTAVAIAMYERGETKDKKITLRTKGGELQVHFEKQNGIYTNVILQGPAKQVFKGIWKK